MYHRENREGAPGGENPQQRRFFAETQLPVELERLDSLAQNLGSFSGFHPERSVSRLVRIVQELEVLDRLIGAAIVDSRLRQTLDMVVLCKDICAPPLASAGRAVLNLIGSQINPDELSAQFVRRSGTSVHKMCVEKGLAPHHVADLLEPGAASVHPESFLIKHIVARLAELRGEKNGVRKSSPAQRHFEEVCHELEGAIFWRKGRMHLNSVEPIERLLSLSAIHSHMVSLHPWRVVTHTWLVREVCHLFKAGLVKEGQLQLGTDYEIIRKLEPRKQKQLLAGIDKSFEIQGLWRLRDDDEHTKVWDLLNGWLTGGVSVEERAKIIPFQHLYSTEDVLVPAAVSQEISRVLRVTGSFYGMIGVAVDRELKADKREDIDQYLLRIAEDTGVKCILPLHREGGKRAA